MKNVHVVIPDLFLPQQLATFACADMRFPALEKLLSRGHQEALSVDSLEAWLCEKFGVKGNAIAPVTLLAEGEQPGTAYWLRADPVGISLQRNQMILNAGISLDSDESAQLCDSLNTHFAADGLRFVAPQPHRWYLRLQREPKLATIPLSQVVGASINAHLPTGEDALYWHGVLNEIQMLFHSHAVNQAREQQGKQLVNGVWLWGGGMFKSGLLKPYAGIMGDSELARAFGLAAGLPLLNRAEPFPCGWGDEPGDLLLVSEQLRDAMQRADIDRWRNAVLLVEKNYAKPLLELLSAGKIKRLTLDVPGENSSRRFVVTQNDFWKIWRKTRPLSYFATITSL